MALSSQQPPSWRCRCTSSRRMTSPPTATSSGRGTCMRSSRMSAPSQSAPASASSPCGRFLGSSSLPTRTQDFTLYKLVGLSLDGWQQRYPGSENSHHKYLRDKGYGFVGIYFSYIIIDEDLCCHWYNFPLQILLARIFICRLKYFLVMNGSKSPVIYFLSIT